MMKRLNAYISHIIRCDNYLSEWEKQKNWFFFLHCLIHNSRLWQRRCEAELCDSQNEITRRLRASSSSCSTAASFFSSLRFHRWWISEKGNTLACFYQQQDEWPNCVTFTHPSRSMLERGEKWVETFILQNGQSCFHKQKFKKKIISRFYY